MSDEILFVGGPWDGQRRRGVLVDGVAVEHPDGLVVYRPCVLLDVDGSTVRIYVAGAFRGVIKRLVDGYRP